MKGVGDAALATSTYNSLYITMRVLRANDELLDNHSKIHILHIL
jgi:hypothetical protein